MLRFNSEAERMQHPQASLIPRLVWQREFFSELSGAELNLMQVSQEHLDTEVKNIVLPNEVRNAAKNAKKCWICIALSHSCDDAELIRIANLMKMSLKDVFIAAVTLGKISTIEKVVALALERKMSIKDLISSDSAAALSEAATYNFPGVMDKLFIIGNENGVSIKDMLEVNGFVAIRQAASFGHFVLTEKLINLSKQNNLDVREILQAGNYEPFMYAASHGHLPIVNMLLALADEYGVSVKAMLESSAEVFPAVAHSGRVDVMH